MVRAGGNDEDAPRRRRRRLAFVSCIAVVEVARAARDEHPCGRGVAIRAVPYPGGDWERVREGHTGAIARAFEQCKLRPVAIGMLQLDRVGFNAASVSAASGAPNNTAKTVRTIIRRLPA